MDFSSVVQTWQNVLMHPGEDVFRTEEGKPEATLATAIMWIVLAGAVGFIAGLIRIPFAGKGFGGGLLIAIATLILTPVAFLIVAGLVHLAATILKGTGDYGKFTYLLATFQTPIIIVSAIIGLIPLLGSCIGAILGIYGLVLAYFATKVHYNLSSGKAIIAVLVPVVLGAILVGCAGAVGAAALIGLGGR